jgi:transketolase
MSLVGDRDKRLVVIVGDISHGILHDFRRKFPTRYFNIGISEPGMVNVAAGLSASGLVPVIHTIAPFLIERSYEQIKLDFAYQNLGANFVSVGSAFEYSKLGCSHHCYTDYSLLSKFETCDIYYPGTTSEFKILFDRVYDNGRINYFRLTEHPNQYEFPTELIIPGVPIFERNGSDVTIVAAGSVLERVRSAATLCEELGYSIEVLYLHTLKPIDISIIAKSVRKTKRILMVEENHISDGVFSAINNYIGGSQIYKKSHLGIGDFIRSYGSYVALTNDAGLSESDIVDAVKDLMQ